MTGEGTQPGKTLRAFHLLALEGKNCNPTGGPGASTTVRPLWDAHARGVSGKTNENSQMHEGDVYALTKEIHGYSREVWGNIVQLVRKGARRAGVGSGTV